METNRQLLNRRIGILTIRLVLGFIFLMQGYGKVFNFGVDAVHNNFFAPQYKDIVPEFITIGTAYYTSYVELIGGLLLIIGFRRDFMLYLLGSVLVIVTFGHGLTEPIWDLSHVMYRLILLAALLLLPYEWDHFSLDQVIQRNWKNSTS